MRGAPEEGGQAGPGARVPGAVGPGATQLLWYGGLVAAPGVGLVPGCPAQLADEGPELRAGAAAGLVPHPVARVHLRTLPVLTAEPAACTGTRGQAADIQDYQEVQMT